MNAQQQDQDKALEALQLLEGVRESFEEFARAWTMLMQTAHEMNLRVAVRADAYKPFLRDQGMGQDPEAWFDEAQEAFEDVAYSEDPVPCPHHCGVEGLNDPVEMQQHIRFAHQ